MCYTYFIDYITIMYCSLLFQLFFFLYTTETIHKPYGLKNINFTVYARLKNVPIIILQILQ